MKYTICTVVNNVYLDFLYYFTKSALEKCENLDTLKILFTGNSFSTDSIYDNNKIEIIKHSETIATKKVWDSGWAENVNLKSKFLRELAEKSDQPIFLIDVDCYFKNEFIDTIDITKDIVVTKRNYGTPYIASFVGLIKPKLCLEFIDVWRNNINSIKSAPKETKALCKTITELKHKLQIQDIAEDIISARKVTQQAKILHFKGSSVGDINSKLKDRLNALKSIL